MDQDLFRHQIRLRGPWQFAWQHDHAPAGTFQHPDDWPQTIGNRSGTIALRRRFHAPTNIDAHEEVFVVLTGVNGTGTIRLNDKSLGGFETTRSTWEFRLPRDLPRFNELAIDVSFPASTPETPLTGLYDTVLLEIRGPAK